MPYDAAWHFRRAQDSYEQAAQIQVSMATRLVSALRQVAGHQRWAKVFEIGCGALTLTKRLKAEFELDQLWLNDLWRPEAQLLDLLSVPELHFLEGDAEHLPWPNNCSLIAGNAVVQWFQQPTGVLEKAHASLSPSGVLALGLFLPGTFAEFQQASGRGLPYPSPEAWQAALAPGHWHELYSHVESTTLVFSSARQLWRHLRETGVGGTTREVWTRTRWEHFLQTYPRDAEGQWPLTYRSWLWLLRRNP